MKNLRRVMIWIGRARRQAVTLRVRGQPVRWWFNESMRQPGLANATNRIRRRLKMIARCLHFNVPMYGLPIIGYDAEVAGHSPVRKLLTVQSRLHNLTVRWRIAEWRGMAAKDRGLAADWRGPAVVILSVGGCLAASQRLNFCLSTAIIGSSIHERAVEYVWPDQWAEKNT